MVEHEQKQIVAMMHIQIIQDGVDALNGLVHPAIHLTEKVDEVSQTATWIASSETLSGRFPQGPIDIAFRTTPIVNLLFGPLGRTDIDVDSFLPWIALGCHWSHLVEIQDDAALWWLFSQAFDG